MDRIIVRALGAEDLATRVEWFNDTAIYTQMMLQVPISLTGTQQWFARIASDSSRCDFSFFGVPINGEENLVAMGGLVDINYFHRRAELYIVVKPSMTGKGIGQRVLHWLCNYGFVHHNLNRILLYTVESNNAARRFYERSGFIQEGIMRQHAHHNGNDIDRYIHAILRSEWKLQSWHTQESIQFNIDNE